jgi:hypothetical protein
MEKSKLEHLLREVGHDEAIPIKRYGVKNDLSNPQI